MHSELVLKFFESQSSDPKPARLEKFKPSSVAAESSISNDAESELNYRTQEIRNLELEDQNNESDPEDNNSHFEYEDEIGEDDNDSVDQYMDRYTGHNHYNYNNLSISNSMVGLNINHRRSANREAGLWWDEDEALNELTSSMSFDFIGN